MMPKNGRALGTISIGVLVMGSLACTSGDGRSISEDQFVAVMTTTMCQFIDQCCQSFQGVRAKPSCDGAARAELEGIQSAAKAKGLVYDGTRAADARDAFAQKCTRATTSRTVDDAEALLEVVWAPPGFVSRSKSPGEPCGADAECRVEGQGVKCGLVVDGGMGKRVCNVYLHAAVGESCVGTLAASYSTGPRGKDYRVPLCNDDEATCPGAVGAEGFCAPSDAYCLNAPATCTLRVDEGSPCAGDTYASCKNGLYCSSAGATAGTCLRAKPDGSPCGASAYECLSHACGAGTCGKTSSGIPVKADFCTPP